MNGIVKNLVFFLLFPIFSAVASDPPIQRYLASLRLGDTLEEIQSVYPPRGSWSARKGKKFGDLTYIEVERAQAKAFAPNATRMRMWLRYGRLVRLQLIYEKDYTRRKPLSKLVTDYSLIYGEPRRHGLRYFWWDSSTVLQAANAEIPVEGGKRVELRISLELMNRSQFKPND